MGLLLFMCIYQFSHFKRVPTKFTDVFRKIHFSGSCGTLLLFLILVSSSLLLLVMRYILLPGFGLLQTMVDFASLF